MFILSNKSILDFSKNLLNLPVRIPIDDFLCFATYGCCHPCLIIYSFKNKLYIIKSHSLELLIYTVYKIAHKLLITSDIIIYCKKIN